MAFEMISLPWSRSEATYTDDEWSDTWRKLFTKDRTTQGVLSRHLNELEVSNPSGVTIRVATGAGLVDGKFVENDTQRDFTIVAPGSGSNFYTVVLRKVWVDEDVYLDILGPNVVAPPAVTQSDGTTWEISLATVEITSASVVTVTDVRVWISPKWGTAFVQSPSGNNATTPAQLIREIEGVRFSNSVDSYASIAWQVPQNFLSDLDVRAVFNSLSGPGNVYASMQIDYGSCGEAHNVHNITVPPAAIPMVASTIECVMNTNLPLAAIDDFVLIGVVREATNVLDTYESSSLFFSGVEFRYLAK